MSGHKLSEDPVGNFVQLEPIGIANNQEEADGHPKQRRGNRLSETFAKQRQDSPRDENQDGDFVG